MPDGRPFFVIGQRSGSDLTVWQVQAAPESPEELAEACGEIRWDAHDAGGSVEIVYAANTQEAEATARREAAETAEQISQDLTRQRAKAARHPRRRVLYRRA
ncbi:hypothetical protein [Streptomyces sp. NPDC095817]|uniref:hypothetical protein n=1 Tax=Streptomyces sp. NPDC095817 TaxID=3155082 RepID=UPI003332A308